MVLLHDEYGRVLDVPEVEAKLVRLADLLKSPSSVADVSDMTGRFVLEPNADRCCPIDAPSRVSRPTRASSNRNWVWARRSLCVPAKTTINL